MTRNSMRQLITKLQKRNAELEAENAQLKLEQNQVKEDKESEYIAQQEGVRIEDENDDSEEVQE